jgi:DNA polymerase-3 subunit delta
VNLAGDLDLFSSIMERLKNWGKGLLDLLKPKEIDQLLKLLSPPDPNRIVIFRTPAAREPKSSSALVKKMSEVTEAVKFDRLKFDETKRTIDKRLKKSGISISDEALTMFAELVDGDRGGLEGELNKLLNYKEKGERVETFDIEKSVIGHEQYNVFELADLIVQGDVSKAMRMIHSLLYKGVNEIQLAHLLQQHFTSLLLVKSGKNPLGNRHYFIGKFRGQASGYTIERLEEIIIEIAAADADLRRGAIKKETRLEMLILALAGEKKVGK